MEGRRTRPLGDSAGRGNGLLRARQQGAAAAAPGAVVAQQQPGMSGAKPTSRGLAARTQDKSAPPSGRLKLAAPPVNGPSSTRVPRPPRAAAATEVASKQKQAVHRPGGSGSSIKGPLHAADAPTAVQQSPGGPAGAAATSAGAARVVQPSSAPSVKEQAIALIERGELMASAEVAMRMFKDAQAAGDDELCSLIVQVLPAPALDTLQLQYAELVAQGSLMMPHTAVAVLVRRSKESGVDWRLPQEGQGNTHLMAAAVMAGDVAGSLCSALVAAGLPVDAANKDGDTALFLAARAGNLKTCEALLASAADPLARNNHNRTPGSQLRLSDEVKALLQQAEAVARHARARRDALWEGKLAATQTANACIVRSV